MIEERMKKRFPFILFFFIIIGIANAQNVEEIKSQPNVFLWGEGTGITLKKADQEALASLISQISTQVKSSFSQLTNEVVQSGKEDDVKRVVESVINTYSNATLKNTERIVLGDEPDAKVFRYINREQVKKIFNERKDVIKGFVKDAEKCEENLQIADALRYYYWALALLKSHPDGYSINYLDMMGKEQLLATWLPHQINSLFANIDISISDREINEKSCVYTLKILYKNQLVENFDYAFWDGKDWSNMIIEVGKNKIKVYRLWTKDSKKIKLKAEYIFEGEARFNRELESVLNEIDPISFRQSYFKLDLSSLREQVAPVEAMPTIQTIDVASNFNITEVKHTERYDTIMQKIIEDIKSRNYLSSEDLFTPGGYDIFTKLINYGNARIIGIPQLRYMKFNDKVVCRTIPMNFKFKSNNKEFIEKIVFYFNKDGKIESLSFSLSKIALDNIIQKKIWTEKDRMILISFLEHYKTSYALKRINYIEQIFSDDALIITGSVVKTLPNDMNTFRGNKIVKYNRQSKQQYIKNLRYMFKSKEYVNIKFEESIIRKAGKGGNVFGVQIKQNFFSSNYGDVGYLFLMVDLNNPDMPIIHVRTWQPDVKTDSSVYGLNDFN